MTYSEYNQKLMEYNKAMSSKKSLQMTIRMNKVWITGDNKRSNKRRKIIMDCQIKLDSLIVPEKPQIQYGFDIITKDDTYFAPTTNINIARSWCDDEIDVPFTIQQSKRQITTDYNGLTW